jgi:hypothetical protein
MLSLLLLALQFPDTGSTYHGRAGRLDVRAPRLEAAARVDGALDEPVWREAALLTGFSQYRPVDGRPAEDSTEVRVWYAPDAIWFGVRAFEAHGDQIRATLADRDNIDADDQVQILLDTFNDRRRALMFAVNPLGVQQDGVRSEGQEASAGGVGAGFRFDGIVDLNPDFVFHSAGRVHADGYEIEVRIPFKSLRYQGTDPQTWGLQVVRLTQHSRYEDTWTPVVRANASFLVQAGRLTDLSGLDRGLVLDVTPEFTTRLDGAPAATGYDYATSPDLGGTARWGITQNLTLGATANPDFSQVEADIGQVTLNERFELFYPEKRPFFLEGLEQYDTPRRLIYTRRVFDPVAGAKLSGKIGATGVGYLFAADDDQRSASGDTPIYNLLRLRRDVGTSSTVGLVYTDRIDGAAYNRVAGADLRLVWRKIWFSDAQLTSSWTGDGAGSRRGLLWATTLYDRTGRSYGNHFEIAGVHPDFQADAGFVNRTDVVALSVFNRFSFYGKPGALVEQASTFIGFQPLWRYDDVFPDADPGRGGASPSYSTIEGTISDSWTFALRGGWEAGANVQTAHQRFLAEDYAGYRVDSAGTAVPFVVPGGLYGLWSGRVSLNTPNRAVTFTASVGAGRTAIFAEAVEGRGVDGLITATWKPTAAVRIEGRWSHRRLARVSDGSWFSTANIPRLKLEYQLTRDVFVRYVGQYTAQEQAALRDPRSGNGLVLPGDSVAAGRLAVTDFRNDVLFSYKPSPGTVFFLGYGASLTDADPFAFERLTRTADGFFLKASYQFRW